MKEANKQTNEHTYTIPCGICVRTMVFLQIIALYIFIHSNIRPSKEIIELALVRKRNRNTVVIYLCVVA